MTFVMSILEYIILLNIRSSCPLCFLLIVALWWKNMGKREWEIFNDVGKEEG